MMHPVGRISAAPSGKNADGGANAPYQAYGVISNFYSCYAVKAARLSRNCDNSALPDARRAFRFAGRRGGAGDIECASYTYG